MTHSYCQAREVCCAGVQNGAATFLGFKEHKPIFGRSRACVTWLTIAVFGMTANLAVICLQEQLNHFKHRFKGTSW